MIHTNYSAFRWYILFTMIVVTSVTAMAMIAPASVLGILFKEMKNLDPGQVTFVTMGSFSFFMAVAAILGGVFLDRFGAMRVFIAGMILIMMGAVLMPIIGDSMWGMLLIRLLQGFGTGPVMAAGTPIAASFFPTGERSIVTGAQGFSVGLGMVIGILLVPRLSESGGSLSALRVLAPITIIGLVFSVTAMLGSKADESQEITDQQGNDAAVSYQFKKALLMPPTWIAIGCFTLMSGIFQQFNSIVVPYIGSDPPLGLGRGALVGANVLLLATISLCIGAFTGGVMTEKVFRGKVRPVIAIGFLAGAICVFFTRCGAIASNQNILSALFIVASFFFAWVNPQSQSYLAKNYPKEITGKLGGVTIFVGILIGSTFALWWLGKSLSATGNYMQPISIMAVLCLAGFILSLFLKQKTTPCGGG